jgi:hypothetical protein
MLSFYLCVGLPRGGILSRFPTNFFTLFILYHLSISSSCDLITSSGMWQRVLVTFAYYVVPPSCYSVCLGPRYFSHNFALEDPVFVYDSEGKVHTCMEQHIELESGTE